MSETRHPDIEIYVKNSSLNAITQWLETCSDQLGPIKSSGVTHTAKVRFGADDVAVMIHERVVGKAWLSVWFQSDKTPWATDLECARVASKALDTQVRCIASGWNEGDDPDEWWKIEAGNEEKISWHTS